MESQYIIFCRFYEDLKGNNMNDTTIINSRDIFSPTMSPPPAEDLKIEMDEPFSVRKFRECVLYALRSNEDRLTRRTWYRLHIFFQENQQCENRMTQIKYEVLLTFCKIDRQELFKHRSKVAKAKSDSEHFDEKLSDLLAALRGHFAVLNLANDECGKEAFNAFKEYLTQPIIIQGFVSCLNGVFGEGKVDAAAVEQTIQGMKIYVSFHIGTFRGFTLRDGILLVDNSTFNFARLTERSTFFLPPTHRAALLTLCLHETAHHLARKFCNDYNFSSPFYGRSSYEGPLADPFEPSTNFELGRAFELLLFDGRQPDWSSTENSSTDAAEAFLERAKMKNELPLLSRSEEYLKLVERQHPSIALGVELVNEDEIVDMYELLD